MDAEELLIFLMNHPWCMFWCGLLMLACFPVGGAKSRVMCENTGKCQLRTLSTVFHLHSPGLITTTITIALNNWLTIRSEGGVKIQVRGYF